MKSLNKGVKAAQGKEYFQAGEHFKRSVADYRDNHNAWFMWGEIETKQAIKSKKKEMWLSAAEKYKEAVKRQGNPAYLMKLGTAQFEAGRKEEAVQNFRKALEKWPELFEAHLYLGRYYRDQFEMKQAAGSFTRAIELNPKNRNGYLALGLMYLDWDMLDHALKVLKNAEKQLQRDENGLARIFFLLGRVYDEKRDWEASVESYTASIRRDPDSAVSRLQRGLAYKELGERKRALNDFTKYKAMSDARDRAALRIVDKHICSLNPKCMSRE